MPCTVPVRRQRGTAARVRQATGAVHVRQPRPHDSVAVAPPRGAARSKLAKSIQFTQRRMAAGNAEGQCWCYRAGAGQEMRQALCRACIVGEPAPFGGCSGCRWKVVPACGLTGVARMALDGLAVVGGGYASVCPGKDVIRVEAAAAVL